MKWFSWGRALLMVPALYLFVCLPYAGYLYTQIPDNGFVARHDAQTRVIAWVAGPLVITGGATVFLVAVAGLITGWYHFAPPAPEPEWKKLERYADAAEKAGRPPELVERVRALAAEMKEAGA